MAAFFREWGRLLAAPLPWIGGVAPMLKFISAATLASVATAVAAWFGDISGWILPVVVFIVGYLALTAGMAWERALPLYVEVGSLKLDENRWGGSIGLFHVLLKNGPIPATIKVKINGIYSLGIRHSDRAWEGHWRSRGTDFNGHLDAREEQQYGLIGIGTQQASGHPTLFIWTRELDSSGQYPTASLDAPLEQQGITRVDIVVNCEAADGQRGKSQERTFYILPDRNSPIYYRVDTAGSPVDKRKSCMPRTYRRFLRFIGHVIRTAKRTRRNRRNHPGRTIGKMNEGSS